MVATLYPEDATIMVRRQTCLALLTLLLTVSVARAQQAAVQLPSNNLLANGWGVTPAGDHVSTSDLILKMIFSPDRKRLVAVSGGYNKEGLTLIDPSTKRVTQHLPMTEA